MRLPRGFFRPSAARGRCDRIDKVNLSQEGPRTCMTTSRRRSAPPPVVEFEHVPSDAEAAVCFPHRGLGSFVQRRLLGDREQWEVPPVPLGCVAASLAMPVAGLACYRRFIAPDDPHFGFMTAMIFPISLGLFAIVYALNRHVADANPLVVVDHARHEFQISGADEPISIVDAVEIITWKLSPENLCALEIDSESNDEQTSVLVRRGERFALIFLFDMGNVVDWQFMRTWPYVKRVHAAQQLADSLGVPWRRIGNVSVARDLRPPNRFSKRPEEITKRFGKRKASP